MQKIEFKNYRLAKVSTFVIACIIVWGAYPLPVKAETFKARFSIDLCPEYKLDNSSLVIKYTIGDDPTIYKTSIQAQVINSSKTSGDFDIQLPADFGATPIYVFAYCYNRAQRQGRISNIFKLSNCDRLMSIDRDKDGLKDGVEDVDCSNEFSPGDYSNLHNVDTDGDGMRDLVEFVYNTDPSNPGSSPRPMIFHPAPFDPDNNGNSNPVVWRPSNGEWYIRDYRKAKQMLTIPFGKLGDIPFTYKTKNAASDVGVIRIIDGRYYWYFRGDGFKINDGTSTNSIKFGYWGDNIAIGSWEKSGITNPALVRYYKGVWEWDVYLANGTIRRRVFGGPRDVPKFADYDGDGIFDIGVYRFDDKKLYVVFSSDRSTHSYRFGTLTAEIYFRGDVTGDGIDDITFWESKTALFSSLKSDSGFNDELAAVLDPLYYQQENLGTYGETIPLSSFKIGNKVLYTVVNHDSGYRYYRHYNNPNGIIRRIQWGLPGDAQG